jgi:cbb3-type cytochrome oxidase maturation protein
MEILYLLIPLAVGLMVVAIAFFLWTVRSGQYEDLEGPAHRILMDDDDPMIPANAQVRKKTMETDRSNKPDTKAHAGDGTVNAKNNHD